MNSFFFFQTTFSVYMLKLENEKEVSESYTEESVDEVVDVVRSSSS